MLDWLHTLWDYNYWAHGKLWDGIMALSDEDFKRPAPYSHGSLHTQLIHVIWAEALWLTRLHEQPRPTFTADDYPQRAAIRAKWDAVEAEWRAYIAALTPDDLTRQFDVVRFNGEVHPHTVRDVLIHVVNHGTDHRAQMLQLIDHYGGPTFDQDYMYFARDAGR